MKYEELHNLFKEQQPNLCQIVAYRYNDAILVRTQENGNVREVKIHLAPLP